jgi:hypothetical protein
MSWERMKISDIFVSNVIAMNRSPIYPSPDFLSGAVCATPVSNLLDESPVAGFIGGRVIGHL